MSYAGKQDLLDRYGAELARMQASDAQIQSALDDADAEINSYIGQVANVPLTTVPRIVTLSACAIARYRLWKDKPSEAVSNGYASTIAWLKAVAAGTAALADNVAPPQPVSGDTPQISAPTRSFTRDSMVGF